ncbi:Rgg/GadR/MutR family transcriptional regulator (plasmid) [Lactobacillus sp. ESL0731]|uniref:helix-turn-helix domain-containing protein n=1 Tax=Lactobacillus sp. ESL0731 TaxID=2983221 RepID=UPI0023FA1AF4|nr:Rgg/GadR/MutR family transcriptional regulator [Lactobacillus sp. ESL0731]WEV63198.1 Rgg/GadR/MutR family transcriptional regulator [Lactobacillus sp. ESL0731]
MLTIGELLKDYRIEQRKTQREWAGAVISPSFYAKVEKNLSRISAEDLVDLLYANKVSLIDFFSKLNREAQSIHNQEKEIDRLLNEAYYKNSKIELEQIKKVVSESNLLNKEDELLLIDVYIAVLDNNFDSLDEKTRNKVKNKIFNIANFDEDNINLYCNFMTFFDIDSNLMISKRIIQQFKGNDRIDIQKTIFGIIINIVILCIENKKYMETTFFIESATQIVAKPEIFFYKNILKFLQAIIDYHYEAKKEYIDQCLLIIDDVALAGMVEYSKELKKFFVTNTKKKD